MAHSKENVRVLIGATQTARYVGLRMLEHAGDLVASSFETGVEGRRGVLLLGAHESIQS